MNKLRKNHREPSNSLICTMCKVEKSFLQFGNKKNGWIDLQGDTHKWHCRACDVKYNAQLHEKNPFNRLFHLAKRRAKEKNMEFTLTKEIVKSKFPKDNKCPVTKKTFLYGLENKHFNPTIDRIDNNKGYTPNNIMIISYRVNSIKRDTTDFTIFKQIADFYLMNKNFAIV
tara:strand:+ start:85 stop:597 length:513 start_codon:yes stop_codon:yes gene_type:complete